MRSYASPERFFEGEALDIARLVWRATGIPISLLLAQMAQESGFGTSDAWVSRNNPAGLMAGGRAATFADWREAAEAYARALLLPYYDQVRAAARAGRPLRELVRLLGESPWDAGQYRLAPFGPGGKLWAIIQEYNLVRFDAMEGVSPGIRIPLPSKPLLFGLAGLALSVVAPLGTLALIPISRVAFAYRRG